MKANEQDLLFITTSLDTKWLRYQQAAIEKYFPTSKRIVIPGTKNWPYAWFEWITLIKQHSNYKYFIHIDEDCFIVNPAGIYEMIEKMEKERAVVCGVPDGGNEWRRNNPIAINSFLMVGKIEEINKVDFELDTLELKWEDEKKEWVNNKSAYLQNKSNTPDTYRTTTAFSFNNFEPYYYFFSRLQQQEYAFSYIYPAFDKKLKSTNPRIHAASEDIAIHMWLTRKWNSDILVFGAPNYWRYMQLEHLLAKNDIISISRQAVFSNYSMHLYRGSKCYLKNLVRRLSNKKVFKEI